MGDDHAPDQLESREPSVEDLVELCRWLNDAGAKYVVVGGFAVRAAPGEVQAYAVVRVADEIVIDLMSSASGIAYREASADVAMHDLEGVSIPFASPRLLYRMKSGSMRDKDAPDVHFLRTLLRARGELDA